MERQNSGRGFLLALLALFGVFLAGCYRGWCCPGRTSSQLLAPELFSSNVVSAAAAAAAASLQCGFAAPVSAAMPAGSVVSDAPLPPVGHPSCADVEAALRGAVRGAQPAAARAWGDGLSDGPLALPAGCALRWFSPAQACGALPGLLLLLGDSLSRNLAFALMQVLSGNYAAGYMLGFQRPPDDPFNGLFLPTDWHSICRCDEAYRACAHLWPPLTVRHFASVCPSWGTAPAGAPPPLHFLPWFGGFFNGSHVEELLEADFLGAGGAPWDAGAPPRARRPVFVVEVGPGWAEGFIAGNPAIEAFLDRVFAAAARGPRGPARVVCYLIPAPVDKLKPAQFVASQGLAPTRALNEWIAGLCKRRGGRVLDALPLSLDTYTRDGTHYTTRIMTTVAQALLNLLLQPWEDEP